MRVFKPLTAFERAQAERRQKQISAIKAMSDVDKIVVAKRQICNLADRPQGMKPRHAYTRDSDYLRAQERAKTRTVNWEDREHIPRMVLPTGRGDRRKNTLRRIMES